MQGFTNFERREYCYEEGWFRGAHTFVEIETDTPVNAQNREQGFSAFGVFPAFFAVFPISRTLTTFSF